MSLFLTPRRAQVGSTRTIARTTAPYFGPNDRTAHFVMWCSDPTAVVHVCLYEEGGVAGSRLLGQWILTLKHLVRPPAPRATR